MEKMAQPTTLTTDFSMPIGIPKGEIELKTLTLMTGYNGVGKSVIMKLYWLMTAVSGIFVANPNMSSEMQIGMLQFYFNNTFVNNDFAGRVRIAASTIWHLEVALFEGVVTKVISALPRDVKALPHPMYASASMRLLTDITQFLRFRQLVGGVLPGRTTNDRVMARLLSVYRLYDILYAETFLDVVDKLDDKGLEEINKNTINNDKHITVLKGLTVDYDDCDVLYTDEAGKQKSVSTLGSGEQALIALTVLRLNTSNEL